jgi:hypothetical protein
MVAPTKSSAPESSAPESSAPESSAPRPISDARRTANQRNAEKSTGPRTPEGKARASRNATTHGIFCRDLVLVGEDPEQFDLTRDGFLDALKPQDAAQLALVDGAVSARWRLNRCQYAEAALIEQRITTARARVTERFASLERAMCLDDFSAAAIAAQCEQSELFRRHHERWKTLRACQAAAEHPGHALAALVQDQEEDRASLERLSRYEHRLEQTFHRCLRDLHVLKQKAKQYADEPASPFRITSAARTPTAAGIPRAAAGHETRPPSPLAGEGGGEGDARGVGLSSSAESSEADLRNNPSSLHTVPPHPNPLPQGERGPDKDNDNDENAPVQNEPTAAAPDPSEMAALRQLTERLSRCRPLPDDDVL